MKKIQILILLVVIVLLSACSSSINNQVNLNYADDGTIIPNIRSDVSQLLYKDVLVENNDSFTLKVFVVAYSLADNLIPNNTNSSYAFQIITKENMSIDFTCNDKLIYNINLAPNQSIDYVKTIPNNNFIGKCDNGNIINIQISVENKIIFESNFEYLVEISDVGVNGFQIYQEDQYNKNNYLYIGLIFLVLEIILIFIYRLMYKVNINRSLKSVNKKIKRLINVDTFIILSLVILLGLYFGTMCLSKQIFTNTHYSEVYVSDTTATIFDIDLNNLTLEKTEVRVVDGELITRSSRATVVELDFDYLLIKNNIETILSNYNGKKVCSSHLACTLYGPMPAIILTFSDGQTEFTFGINNQSKVPDESGIGSVGNETIYISGTNAEGFLTFQIYSGYEEELYDIFLKVLSAYESIKDTN